MNPRRVTIGSGLGMAALAAPMIYALLRVIELKTNREPDPAAVIFAEHSRQLTRLSLTFYVSLVSTAGWVAICSRWPRSRERLALGAASASAVVVALQAALWP